MTNNSNPFDLDAAQVRKKGKDEGDTVKATVLDVLTELHAVRVNPRGGDTPFIAPVFTPMYGTSALPKEGERVTLIYVAENTPIALGAVYLEDGESPPDSEPGDFVLGNGTGSHVTIHEDGHITVATGEYQSVDIDHQSMSAYLEQDQQIPGDDTYYLVEFDAKEDDPENLFDTSTHTATLRHGGKYEVDGAVEISSPGQGNLYRIAVFVNGTLEKRKSQQSGVNEPLSVQVHLNKTLDADDEIEIRLRQNSGTDKTLEGLQISSAFDIQRHGI